MKKSFVTFIELLILALVLACFDGGGGGGSNGNAETGGSDEIVFTGAIGAEEYIEPGIKKSLLGKNNSNVYYVVFDAFKSTWEEKFVYSADVQTMIDAAGEAAVITGTRKYVFIQEGEYSPGTARDSSFSMKNNVTIIGGFLGTEEDGVPLGENTKTILTGKNNSYHVFYHAGATSVDDTAQMRNVTITGGNANGSGIARYGGGMYNDNSSPSLAGCIFLKNSVNGVGTGAGSGAVGGGGMYNIGDSSPSLISCSLTENKTSFTYSYSPPFPPNYRYSAYVYGGGIYHEGSKLTLSGCTFTANTASISTPFYSFSYGGGLYNNGSDKMILTDCTFKNNTVSGDGYITDAYACGGAVYSINNNSDFINCFFIENTAFLNTFTDVPGGMTNNAYGGGLYAENNVILKGCTFKGNITKAYFPADSIFQQYIYSLGGGAYFVGNIKLSDCTFIANISSFFSFGNLKRLNTYGGGIYFVNSTEVNWNTPDSIFSGNISDFVESVRVGIIDHINKNGTIITSPPENVIYQ